MKKRNLYLKTISVEEALENIKSFGDGDRGKMGTDTCDRKSEPGDPLRSLCEILLPPV